MRSGLVQRLYAAVSELPDASGGLAIVMATAGTPPAIAVLSTGDVFLAGSQARVGVHGTSSVVGRLGDSFSLLIPLDDVAVRVEVVDATAAVHGDLALIAGTVSEFRPTAEPPWVMTMRFHAQDGDAAKIGAHLAYWTGVRSWLAGDTPGPPPLP